MSAETTLLTNLLKNTPLANSLENLSLFTIGKDGELRRVSPIAIAPAIMCSNSLPQISDLNEAVEPGIFMLAGTETIVNGPSGIKLNAGMVEVFFRGGSTGTLYQRVTSRFGELATRARTYGTWSEWRILQ